MKENKNKLNAFKSTAVPDWEIAARKELNGANPWEKLVYKGDGWSILPFYDRNEAIASPSLLPPSENNFLGPRTWYNCPRILVKDAKKANAQALAYLQQGADGILFELSDETDFEILLTSVEWQYCSLNFLAKKNSAAIAGALHRYIAEKKTHEGQLHGAFFGNTVALNLNPSLFRFAGFQMAPSASPVNEIISGFNEMSETLGKDFPVHASQVAFSVGIGPDIFLEVAKLRSLRVLWRKFLEATKSKADIPLFIHAYSHSWTDRNYDPHGNMLKGTTAAIASILGGCDALTIDPEDPDNTMMARVAQNVSNILREESYFSKVADPVAGAYFIEDLTRQLTEAAWKSIHLKLMEK